MAPEHTAVAVHEAEVEKKAKEPQPQADALPLVIALALLYLLTGVAQPTLVDFLKYRGALGGCAEDIPLPMLIPSLASVLGPPPPTPFHHLSTSPNLASSSLILQAWLSRTHRRIQSELCAGSGKIQVARPSSRVWRCAFSSSSV